MVELELATFVPLLGTADAAASGADDRFVTVVTVVALGVQLAAKYTPAARTRP